MSEQTPERISSAELLDAAREFTVDREAVEAILHKHFEFCRPLDAHFIAQEIVAGLSAKQEEGGRRLKLSINYPREASHE